MATGVGDVTENDVYMAVGDNTVIYGFNVSVPTNIAKMAARDGVKVKIYKVIYELLDDAKEQMEELLDAEIIEEDRGELKVKGVFRTEKSGIIAGGEMLKGVVRPGMKVRIVRGKSYLGEAEVESVRKEKTDVKELMEGEIGGLALKTEHKIQLELDDRLKFFTREKRKKKL